MLPQLVDPTEVISDVDSLTVWDFVWAVAIVALAFGVAAFARRVTRTLMSRLDIPGTYVLLVSRAVGWFIVLIGILYALGVLGVDLGPAVLALIIIAGVAFFAGRSLLENFGAGLVLQASKMFEVGDQIETVDGTGRVIEVTGRTVIIETVDGKEVNIPNTTMTTEPVTNLTKGESRRSTVTVGVAYGTDLDEAHRVVGEAIAECRLCLPVPPPSILVTELGDAAVTIDARFWHDPTILGGNEAVDQVARAIYSHLSEAGITIAFPQRTLWWGEGQAPGYAEPS